MSEMRSQTRSVAPLRKVYASAIALACLAVSACSGDSTPDGGGDAGPSAGAPTQAGGGANAAGVAGSAPGGSPSTAGNAGTGAGASGGPATAGSSSGGSAGRSNGGSGATGAAGRNGTAGDTGMAGSGNTAFGTPVQGGQGSSSDRYRKTDVTRNGANYYFMANGWGPGFQSQSVTWNGTAFTVVSMQGTQGPEYQPASYPTMFCGVYSDSVSKECGLPKALTEITSIRTGWRWKPNGNTGQYNVAYDVWLSTNATIQGHSSYLMVWLRDPPGQQPAGSRRSTAVTVPNVPGTWDVWSGTVGGKTCVSYVRAEGQDTLELEFDVMDFVRDVPGRSLSVPGSHVLSVAVGFEIWNGPITNLVSEDFYMEAR